MEKLSDKNPGKRAGKNVESELTDKRRRLKDRARQPAPQRRWVRSCRRATGAAKKGRHNKQNPGPEGPEKRGGRAVPVGVKSLRSLQKAKGDESGATVSKKIRDVNIADNETRTHQAGDQSKPAIAGGWGNENTRSLCPDFPRAPGGMLLAALRAAEQIQGLTQRVGRQGKLVVIQRARVKTKGVVLQPGHQGRIDL